MSTPPENAFTIDEDQPASVEQEQPDTFVIEDLDEDPEEQVHDQLPSVEEAKANLPASPANKKKLYLITAAIVGVIALLITTITLAVKKGKNKTVMHEPTGRAAEVIDFLFVNQISPLPSLEDPTSAQHRAAVFVADGDGYQMEFTHESRYRFLERFVLSMIYYHFNGHEWTHRLNFLSARDHCDWWQDFESNRGNTIRQGVICNDDGYVVGLNLGKFAKKTCALAYSIFLLTPFLSASLEQLASSLHATRDQIPWSTPIHEDVLQPHWRRLPRSLPRNAILESS